MRAPRSVRSLLVVRPCVWAVAAAALLGSCGKDEPRPKSTPTYAANGQLLVSRPADVARPNLLVIVVDTLRADALGAGDAQPARMPWLEGLARRGTRFTQAASCSPWTLPSLTSFLTGLTPHEHRGGGESGAPTIYANLTTHAEALSEAYGYTTAAFVGTAWEGGESSMLAGFRDVTPGFELQAIDQALWPWARARDRSKPFFLLLHTYEAHHPYGSHNHPYPALPPGAIPDGPDPVEALGPNPATRDLVALLLTSLAGNQSLLNLHRERHQKAVTRYLWRGLRDEPDDAFAARLSGAYWEGVTWVDDLLRRAAGRLREWGLLDNTLLVVTSDHGEAFGEHGLLMHGRDCHDELIRVPLVLEGLVPFKGGQRVEGSVSLADVLPTFFDLNGMPPIDGTAGRSALPLVKAGGAGRPVESEEWITPAKTGGDGPLYIASLRSTHWKVILTRDPATSEVRERAYDLTKDPLEQHDLAGEMEGAALLPFDDSFRAALLALRRRIAGPLEAPRMAGSDPGIPTR